MHVACAAGHRSGRIRRCPGSMDCAATPLRAVICSTVSRMSPSPAIRAAMLHKVSPRCTTTVDSPAGRAGVALARPAPNATATREVVSRIRTKRPRLVKCVALRRELRTAARCECGWTLPPSGGPSDRARAGACSPAATWCAWRAAESAGVRAGGSWTHPLWRRCRPCWHA